MGKANQKGRSKDRFLMFHHGVWTSPAWLSLSCESRCLLLEIWQRHNGKNNGEIAYSWREARERLRIGQGKVKQAFLDLQDRGFLIARQPGSFDWKGSGKENRSTRWEVTTEACDGAPAKRLYRGWERAEKQTAGTTAVSNGYHVSIDNDAEEVEILPHRYRDSTDSGQFLAVHGYRRGSGFICHGPDRFVRRVLFRTERPQAGRDEMESDWNPVGRVCVVVGPLGPGTDATDWREMYRGAA